MFESRVAIGERVAVWRAPSIEPEPRLRVLLPGQGGSARERAVTAVFVASVQRATRQPTKGPVGRRDARSTERRRVVLPGDPTASDIAYERWRGHPGESRTEMDRALRLGLIDPITEVGAAMMELGCWRTRISALPPGPDLVTALTERPDALAPVPVADPDDALVRARAAREGGVADRVVTGWANAVLESVTARARVLSWLQAEQYTDLAMLSRNYPGLAEMLPTEVGFALRASDTIASNTISAARCMALRLPATLEALRAGLIDNGHAIGLATATGTTTAEVASAVEADLLPLVTGKGSTITAEQLRRRAVRRVIARDPDGATDRHRTAREDRTMTKRPEEDGMAGLKVLATAEQIAAIWAAVTALADAAKHPGDTRTLGARRVDSLTDICLDLLAGATTTTCTNSTTTADTNGAAGTDCSNAGTTTTTCTNSTSSTADTSNRVDITDITDGSDTGGSDTDGSDTDGTSRKAGAADPSGTAGTNNTARASGTADTNGAAVTNGTAEPAFPAEPTTDDHQHPAPQKNTVLPTRHGRRPHIQVLVPFTVLLGGNEACELTGHGAITADQARTIIADGTLQRLLYDPATGIVLDYGRTRYEPPETLKQFITTRDQTCRTPGCLQPAERCHIDHIEPFRPGKSTGGPTNHTNLDTKCAHHHRAKDGGGFLTTRDPDGTTHWTTPLGRTYTIPPPHITDPTANGITDTHDATADPDNPRQSEPYLEEGPPF